MTIFEFKFLLLSILYILCLIMDNNREIKYDNQMDLIGAIKEAMVMAHNLLDNSKVDKGHGYTHAQDALELGYNAIINSKDLSAMQKVTVLLACLLHDVDDRKFFESEDYDNARSIVRKTHPKLEEGVIELISLVSCSKNGNTPVEEPWKAIPRDCDRILALGIVGVCRCFLYTKKVNMPFFLGDTPRCHTEEELWKVATPERFKAYKGESRSMIDHYYDKLLHIHKMSSGNEHLEKRAKEEHKIMVDFVLAFGNTGSIDETGLDDLCKYLV